MTDELAELMDEYGRLQHRFEALGGYGLESEARRILAGLGFADADMERDIGEFSRRLDDARRARPPAARRTRTCCCSTSRPTTSTWHRSSGCQGFLADYAGAVRAGQPRPRLHQRGRQPGRRAARRQRSPSTSATTPTSSSSATSGSPSSSAGRQAQGSARSRTSSASSSGSATRRPRRARSRARIKSLENASSGSPRHRGAAKSGEVPLPRAAAQRPDGDHAEGHRQALRRAQSSTTAPGPGPGARPEGGAHRSERGRQEHAAEDPGRRAGVRGRAPASWARNVRVAYFAQHQIEALNPANTVFDGARRRGRR